MREVWIDQRDGTYVIVDTIDDKVMHAYHALTLLHIDALRDGDDDAGTAIDDAGVSWLNSWRSLHIRIDVLSDRCGICGGRSHVMSCMYDNRIIDWYRKRAQHDRP